MLHDEHVNARSRYLTELRAKILERKFDREKLRISLLRLRTDVNDADDILQLAFLIWWRSKKQTFIRTPEQSLKVARSRFFRSQKRNQSIPARLLERSVSGHTRNAESVNNEKIQRKLLTMDLADSVKTIPNGQTIIKMLANGYTQNEIGNTIGCSQQMVSLTVNAIRQLLA